jgi:mRNA interferase MazF
VFERGDLVLIPFPFSDLSAAKRRPLLLLTRPDAHGDFVALAVTSRPQLDYGVVLDPADLVQGSLPLASWIRTDRVVTLNATLIVKAFGRVSEAVIAAALARLRLSRVRTPVIRALAGGGLNTIGPHPAGWPRQGGDGNEGHKIEHG